jgi:hypothetical protein
MLIDYPLCMADRKNHLGTVEAIYDFSSDTEKTYWDCLSNKALIES